jgi:hypothetical protein
MITCKLITQLIDCSTGFIPPLDPHLILGRRSSSRKALGVSAFDKIRCRCHRLYRRLASAGTTSGKVV